MLWVPQKGPLLVQHNAGTVGTSLPGTVVTTGTPSTNSGSEAELISSTSFDAYWLTIIALNYGSAGAAAEGMIDIALGVASGSVVISGLLMGHCGSLATLTKGPKRWDFPLYIPAGTRISAFSYGVKVLTDMRVLAYVYGGAGYPPFRVGSSVTTYGIGTIPNGVSITPGASGAEGSWTEITSSTSRDHFCLVPSFQVATDTTVTNKVYYLDLGVGAATEEEVAQSYIYATDSGECMEGPINSMPCFIDVPSGSRLTMRVSNSGTNDAAYNGVIHAVN